MATNNIHATPACGGTYLPGCNTDASGKTVVGTKTQPVSAVDKFTQAHEKRKTRMGEIRTQLQKTGDKKSQPLTSEYKALLKAEEADARKVAHFAKTTKASADKTKLTTLQQNMKHTIAGDDDGKADGNHDLGRGRHLAQIKQGSSVFGTAQKVLHSKADNQRTARLNGDVFDPHSADGNLHSHTTTGKRDLDLVHKNEWVMVGEKKKPSSPAPAPSSGSDSSKSVPKKATDEKHASSKQTAPKTQDNDKDADDKEAASPKGKPHHEHDEKHDAEKHHGKHHTHGHHHKDGHHEKKSHDADEATPAPTATTGASSDADSSSKPSSTTASTTTPAPSTTSSATQSTDPKHHCDDDKPHRPTPTMDHPIALPRPHPTDPGHPELIWPPMRHQHGMWTHTE